MKVLFVDSFRNVYRIECGSNLRTPKRPSIPYLLLATAFAIKIEETGEVLKNCADFVIDWSRARDAEWVKGRTKIANAVLTAIHIDPAPGMLFRLGVCAGGNYLPTLEFLRAQYIIEGDTITGEYDGLPA